MTVIRSILLTALILTPVTGWSQVFTAPETGVLRGVGLQPEMQRGLVSPGLSTQPRNPFANGPLSGGYRGQAGSRDSRGFPGDDSSREEIDLEAESDPRFREPSDFSGPATEGYPQHESEANRSRPPSRQRMASNGPKNYSSRPVKPTYAASAWGDTHSVSGAYYAIVGAIGRPAVYYHKMSRIPLLELVKLAGGTTDQASGGVRIVRQGRGGLQTFLSPDSPYEVLNGDVVYIEARRTATKSGLQEFSEPLRRGSGSRTLPTDGENAIEQQGERQSVPTQAYLAMVGVTTRPIVVPVPSNEATVVAAMRWLKLDPESAAWPQVFSPVPLPQARNPMAGVTSLLPNGSVLVFNPAALTTGRLPELPPAVGEAPSTAPRTPSRPNGQADERLQAPAPRNSRPEPPQPRTNLPEPQINPGPPERVPPPPIEARPANQPEVAPVPEELLQDGPVASPDELSFEQPPQNHRETRGGGPLLFSPRDGRFDRPHVRSNETSPRGKGHTQRDSFISPAHGNHMSRGNATTADFQDAPAVIPNGPVMGRPLRHEVAFDEPRPWNAQPDHESRQEPQFQNGLKEIQATPDSAAVQSEASIPAIPHANVSPWYSSTITIFWISSSAILCLLLGLWLATRSEFRWSRASTGASIEDLIQNRLPVTSEAVRPPLGLRLQGVAHAHRNSPVPPPHLAPATFPRGTPNDNSKQASAPVRNSEPENVSASTSAVAPESPVRGVSEQERILRAEFQKARSTSDRSPRPEPATPSEQSSIGEHRDPVSPPHFVSHAKQTQTPNRVPTGRATNLHAPQPNGTQPTDDSAVLSRILVNRHNRRQ